MLRFAAIFLLVPGLALASDHLVPNGGTYTAPFLGEYHLGLRSKLLDGTAIPVRDAAFEVYVLPSFQFEWRLAVSKEASGPCTNVEVTEVERSYWAGFNDKTAASVNVRRKAACIPNEFARISTGAIQKELKKARYPSEPERGLDGISYHFVGFVLGYGYIEGTTWSPDPGTRMSKLVDVAASLRALTDGTKDSGKFERVIRNRVAALGKPRKR